jgi:endonuclease-3 related protein
MPELQRVFRELLSHFGPQHWWPGESAFEVMVGAVLTQSTNWKNVERALQSLRDHRALQPAALERMSVAELAELIRPAGYYRLKARRLKNLVHYLMRQHGGSIESMFKMDLAALRADLLKINGIGPETADSILLYAGKQPTFVVDAYTARLAVRHGWLDQPIRYEGLRAYFTERLPADASLFNEFHALIVRLGKEYCRKQPRCDGCPLQAWLPPTGPLGA